MEMIYLFIGLFMGALITYFVCLLINKSKAIPKEDFDHLKSKLDEAVTASKLNEEKVNLFSSIKKETEEKLNEKELAAAQLQKEISVHQQRVAELTANNSFLNEKLTHQKTEFEELQKTAHLQFEKIANKLFEEKSSKFTETNKANIETLLNPLKEDINKFKTKVEETYDKESKQRFSLDEKIKDLIAQTDKVSAEANNLATALKGKPQKRGNWGEMILERILELSGLRKEEEYSIQESIKDEEGNYLRPDVTVKLPDNRVIIIDSKVSLIAYDNFVATENPDEQKEFLDEHLKSIYNHIDQLSAKKYDDLENSLDYTMMFMPVEPAYLLAIQNAPDLWAYAYSKRIILVSPSNLIALLKMFSDLWRRDAQNKNAMEIVRKGETLYEKFVGFTKTFEEIGNSIHASQEKYDKALGQLKDGRGNLITQAIQLKDLGLKSDKRISANMLPLHIEDVEVEE
jgi:DNA recombination protein RmuC